MNKTLKTSVVAILLAGFGWIGFTQSTTISSLLPPYPHNATLFLNGTGAWSIPSGGGGGGSLIGISSTNGNDGGFVVSVGNSFDVVQVGIWNDSVYGRGSGALLNTSISNSYHVFADGLDSLSVATLTGMESVYAKGSIALQGSILQDSANVYAYGFGALASATITNGSYSVYGYGESAFGSATVNSSSQVFGYGSGVLDSSTVDGSGGVYGYGDSALASATINSSYNIYGYGTGALQSAVITNDSGNVFGYGSSALRSATVSSSVNVYGYGPYALSSATVSGSGNVYGTGAETLLGASLSAGVNWYVTGNQSGKNSVSSNMFSMHLDGGNVGEEMISNDGHDFYYHGDHIGYQSTNVNTGPMFGEGYYSLQRSYTTNCSTVFMRGSYSGSLAKFDNSANVFGDGHAAFSGAVIKLSQDIVGNGPFALANSRLTNSSMVTAIGPHAGYGLTGSYTNIMLIGTNAQPTLSSDQMVLAYPHILLSGASDFTSTPTVNGNPVLTNAAAFVAKAGDTMSGALTGPTINVDSLLVGSMSVYRGTLTHAAGNVIVDFSQTNRYWSCTLTGNVTFVLTNASAGKWANIFVLQTQATNCTPTWNLPAGSTTNWFGGAPSTLTAGTFGSLSYYCIDSTTNSTKAVYSETQ